jgi:hypothetical protein
MGVAPCSPLVHKEEPMRHAFRRSAALVIAGLVLALTVSVASADGPGWTTVTQFEGPVFGLNPGKGDNLVVAGPAGPVILDPDDGSTELIAEIPGVGDVIQTGRREYYVIVGGEQRGPDDGPCPAASLCRIKNGEVTQVADILDWELEHDPDGSGNVPNEDSITNVFDLAKHGNKFLVADAGGNSVLSISKNGRIRLVAVLPPHVNVNLQPLKDAVGCPDTGGAFCAFPDVWPEPIDPVPTTVAVGPKGDIYVGELMGFPPVPGLSRIWRIDRGEFEVRCGEDSDCKQVDAGPLTSISEIEFAKDGTAYVSELDENTWVAAEEGFPAGGSVNACRTGNGRGNNGGDNDRRRGDDDDDDDDNGNGNGNGTIRWTCHEVVTGLQFPTALAIQDGDVYVALLTDPQTFAFEVARLTVNGNGDDDEDDD